MLDLFAGTGALGLEALSRGAAFVLFVDDGAEARALLRGNVDALGAGGATKVYRRDATGSGRRVRWSRSRWRFSIRPTARAWPSRRCCPRATAAGSRRMRLIVVEEAADAAFAAPDGFEEIERRDYGDTQFVFCGL